MLVLLLCGCGAPAAREDGAVEAGRAFEAALASGDYAAACRLLAPESRGQLEQDEKRPCGQALRAQGLPVGGDVRDVDVYGRQALLRLVGETLFLSQFDEGWKVTAAGCVEQPRDTPYQCTVKGA